MSRLISIVLLTALVLPIASPAHAYLDPSTGSMILQMILGGIAGLIVAGRLYLTQLKQFLGLSTGEAANDENATNAETD